MSEWRVVMFVATMLVICACAGKSTPPPAPTPALSCTIDADCVLAIRLDHWCDCPKPRNRIQVEQSPSLLLIPQGYNYSYPIPRTSARPAGPQPICAPCEYIFGSVCGNSQCKLPQTHEETLKLCPGLSESDRTNCYGVAAARAIEQGGSQAARDTCDLLADLEARQACIESVYWHLLADDDPIGAVDFCQEHMPAERHSFCFKTAAETLVLTDVDAGIGMCHAIRIAGENDRWQKDACFSNLAGLLAQQQTERALQLCELVGGETDISRLNCLTAIQQILSPTDLLIPLEPTAKPTPTITTNLPLLVLPAQF